MLAIFFSSPKKAGTRGWETLIWHESWKQSGFLGANSKLTITKVNQQRKKFSERESIETSIRRLLGHTRWLLMAFCTPKYSIPTSECLHSLILEGQCLVFVSIPHWLRSLGSGRGVPIHQSSEPCIKGGGRSEGQIWENKLSGSLGVLKKSNERSARKEKLVQDQGGHGRITVRNFSKPCTWANWFNLYGNPATCQGY